jgi:hypothetical protein
MAFREEVLNVRLSDILKSHGLNSEPERKLPGHNLPDIYIEEQGVIIIIEARSCPLESIKPKAKERLARGLCNISLALSYPSEIKNSSNNDELLKNLQSSKYDAALFYLSEEGIREIELERKEIIDIIDSIKHAISLIVDSDKLTNLITKVDQEITALITMFEKGISNKVRIKIAEKIKSLLAIEGEINKKKEESIIYMVFFLILDALLFHEAVCKAEPGIKSLSEFDHKKGNISSFLNEEWKKILKIDYQPIFMLAEDILGILPADIIVESILDKLRELSLEVLKSGVLLSHDFMGRIYHRLLLRNSGQFYATYYTAIPSAFLLSTLLYQESHQKWEYKKGLSFLRNFRIIDPACGSGTLLSSSYVTLRKIFSKIIGDDEINKFHKIMVEKVIYGWDVLDFASHLSLVVLAQHNPDVRIDSSNIYTLPLGSDDGNIYLGSLSYLDLFLDRTDNRQLPLFPAKSFVKRLSQDESRIIHLDIQPNMFDVVIMNPPFSRSAGRVNVRYGYETEEIKKKMQDKEMSLISRLGFKGIGKAGLGATFIVLADKLIKDNGRLGIVIPRAILSAVSWGIIRNYLNEHYELKYVISNHDPGNDKVEGWNWSENTKLGEVLLILEKTRKKAKETIYINIWNKPENELQSIIYASNVLRKKPNGYIENGSYEFLSYNKRPVGTYYKIRQQKLRTNWLTPCLFANPELNSFAINLLENIKGDKLKNLVLKEKVRGREIYYAGIDRHQIEDNFENVNFDTAYKAIWGQPSWLSRIMEPNTNYIKGTKKESQKLFHRFASDLLIAERIWTTNSRVISLLTKEPVLATLFWEIKLRDEYIPYKNCVVLWFNSTFGIIQYLASSINNMGPWFNMKKEQMLELILPEELFHCDPEEAKEFICNITKLESIGEEFSLANNKLGQRYKIDKYISSKTSFKIDESIYNLLENEPIFTNKRLVSLTS